jgi:hypothetical protein
MQVIHELDNKKSDPRLRDRARRVIAELRQIKTDGYKVRPNVTLELLAEDIRNEEFRPGLNPLNADDRIIQSLLSYKAALAGVEPGIITEDMGMEIKCTNLSIPVLMPKEDTRLPDPDDAQSKKLRQTQQELDRHKNLLPDLALCFKDEKELNSITHFTVILPSIPETDIEIEMKALRRNYPNKEGPLPDSAGNFGTISTDEIHRYNSELEAFYRSYEDYLKMCELLRQVKVRSFRTKFVLENKGRSPANEIDVHIHFPDDMTILDANDLPPRFNEPKPPVPPQQPLTTMQRFLMGARGHDFATMLTTPLKLTLPEKKRNLSSPRITKTSSYDVHYPVEKLKHGYTIGLGELLICFESKEKVKSFGVEYFITADNSPEARSGELHFVLPKA